MQASIGHVFYEHSEVIVNIYTITSYVHTKEVYHVEGGMTIMQCYQRD